MCLCVCVHVYLCEGLPPLPTGIVCVVDGKNYTKAGIMIIIIIFIFIFIIFIFFYNFVYY